MGSGIEFRIWAPGFDFGFSVFGSQIQGLGVLGLMVWNVGFRNKISRFVFRISSILLRVSRFGVRAPKLGIRISGLRLRVLDFGFQVSGLGFWVLPLEFGAPGEGPTIEADIERPSV